MGILKILLGGYKEQTEEEFEKKQKNIIYLKEIEKLLKKRK